MRAGRALVWARDVGPELVEQLYSLNPKRLILCTAGGDTAAMMAVVDYLERFPTEILGTGQVSSAGVPILAAGRRRLLTPRTRLSLHEPQQETLEKESTTARQLYAEAQEMLHLDLAYADILGLHTKIEATEWLRLMRALTTLDAATALRMGLVDEIVPAVSGTRRGARRGSAGRP